VPNSKHVLIRDCGWAEIDSDTSSDHSSPVWTAKSCCILIWSQNYTILWIHNSVFKSTVSFGGTALWTISDLISPPQHNALNSGYEIYQYGIFCILKELILVKITRIEESVINRSIWAHLETLHHSTLLISTKNYSIPQDHLHWVSRPGNQGTRKDIAYWEHVLWSICSSVDFSPD